ncbi:MAG: metallophosphoesterase family protein [Verrucomicrobiota bacterium]
MKIGLISDVHSNLEALHQVLAALKARSVERILNAGDNVGYSAFPNECVALLREEEVEGVMGNYDEAVAGCSDQCGCGYADSETEKIRSGSLRWTQDHISESTREWLLALPGELAIECEGKRVFMVHGGNRALNQFIYPDSTDALSKLAEYSKADLVIMGHTHGQFMLHREGTTYVNPGAAGKPVDGDTRGCCAVVDVTAAGFEIEFIRVDYDVEKNISSLLEAGLPEGIAGMLRNAPPLPRPPE